MKEITDLLKAYGIRHYGYSYEIRIQFYAYDESGRVTSNYGDKEEFKFVDYEMFLRKIKK